MKVPSAGGAAAAPGAPAAAGGGAAAEAPKEEAKAEEKVCRTSLSPLFASDRDHRRSRTTTWASVSSTNRLALLSMHHSVLIVMRLYEYENVLRNLSRSALCISCTRDAFVKTMKDQFKLPHSS